MDDKSKPPFKAGDIVFRLVVWDQPSDIAVVERMEWEADSSQPYWLVVTKRHGMGTVLGFWRAAYFRLATEDEVLEYLNET